MEDQLSFDLGLPDKPSKSEPNPMAKTLGYGPEKTTCKTCRFRFTRQYSKSYHKCKKLGDTKGAATDIRLKWKSCRLYEEREING